MKKTVCTILLFALTLALLLMTSSCGSKKEKPQTTTAPTTTPQATPYLTVIGNGKTDYKIVFAQRSSYKGLSEIASSVRSLATALGVSGMALGYDGASVAEHEILIGDTNRPESSAVSARLAETAGDEYFQFAVAEVDGKLVLIADNAIAYEFYLYDYFAHTYANSETRELKIAEGMFDLQKVTFAEHEAYLKALEEEAKAEEEAKKAAYVAELIKEIASYKLSDFGQIAQGFPTSHDAPEVSPERGAHPRILVTAETLDDVRAGLRHPENAVLYAKFLEFSDIETDGHLSHTASSGKQNMSYDTLTAIESKAFRYLIEGDKKYGYEAILAIKNYILDLYVPTTAGNYCRDYGYTMYIAACVYDWCYDLLTDADRAQITAGVHTKLAPNLEIGFPPTKQGGLTGHGTEAQLYRDWLAYSIACYDEYPEAYDFVAGRLFAEFRDGAEFYMQSGAHWQGSSYGPYRYYFLLFCNLLFDRMSNGNFSFFSDNLHDVSYFFLQTIRPDGKHYIMGDGQGSERERAISLYLASALYGDPTLKGYAKAKLGGSEFSYTLNNNTALTPVLFLCLNDPDVLPEEDYLGKLPLVEYFGSPRGNSVVHTSWNDDAAASVYMKIGEAYSANHEHRDAGHFMIYYKGLLAADSGVYNARYGSLHDYTYLKQTIAHNSILVYNPALANMGNPNTNAYYSGGQSIGEMDENRNLDVWKAKRTFAQAKVLGESSEVVENGAGNADDVFRWAYLAGDLTNAYDAITVDEISRYMLSVATGDEKNPMAFIVFDRITATDPTFKKTFLLHTVTPPTIDTENDRAIVVSGEGKLHVQSLLDDVSYTVIGGLKGETVCGSVNETDKQFWVGDRNFYAEDDPSYAIPDTIEAGWGRIEISPTASQKTSLLLTVMYVTDAANADAPILTSEIDGDGLVGTELFGKTLLFPEHETLLAHEASFTTSATEGNSEYFIMGLKSGLWLLSVNGEEATPVMVDSGVLHFEGAVGTVRLTPAFASLTFHTNGGTAISALPSSYNLGDTLTFPTDLTLFGSAFDGWYTTPTFDAGTRLDGITEGHTESLVLYAKWRKVFDVLSYELNGGAFDGVQPERQLMVGESYRLPASLVKDNAVFLGWYLTPTFEGSPITEIPAERADGDITVYARFQTIYYANDFSGIDKPDVIGTGSSTSIVDGMLVWKNPEANSNFSITPSGSFSDPSQTLSFDLDLRASSEAMNFLIRLRPVKGNVIDTPLLRFSEGKLKLEGNSKVLLDKASCDGIYRITLVMTNDNAGLAAGLNAPQGESTEDARYASTISVAVYINGLFVAESKITTHLTFGLGYQYVRVNPSTGEKTIFSSEMTTFQFYSAFANELAKDPSCPKSVRFDNLMISDGRLTVGGRYFLNIGESEIDPSDTSYVKGGEIVGFPRFIEGTTLEGWYLTPDFSSAPVTSLESLNAGTVLYAKTSQ